MSSVITILNRLDDDRHIITRAEAIDLIRSESYKQNLGQYIKDAYFGDTNNRPTIYDWNSRTIVLNHDIIMNDCYSRLSTLLEKYQIGEEYYKYFIDFAYIFYLLYEVEHANQERKYDREKEDPDSPFARIHEICHLIRCTDREFYHSEKKQLLPIEIDARNYGYKRAWKLISQTKLPERKKRLLYLEYLSVLLHNYQMLGGSILTPFDQLCQLYELDDNKKLDLSLLSEKERLNLGVDITPREYKHYVRKIEFEKKLCGRDIIKKEN